ncbi:MAG TPA: matrixin family metalloprotease [Pyrinomonadaceae bacterium]|nr:matrixin family metalloprotease [Pyrinomonadaceae bacterium]
MRRIITNLVLLTVILSWIAQPARAYSLQYTDNTASVQIKWPTRTIRIALSTSLNSPPANIKQGSDVVGAAHRALARWSEAAGVSFIEISSDVQAISPSGEGDQVSLITVADVPENRAAFASADRTGRTRVFYDPATGTIMEADVVINPAAQFSTDGAPGTYDLEATLTHEIGHVLGLEHSNEAGAAMQPRQGTNGLYEQAATSSRTLSDDDRAGAHALYGAHENFGIIAGTIKDAAGGPAVGAHVFAEDTATGRVVAGNETLANGSYRIEGLPPGRYRLVTEYAGEHAEDAEEDFAKGAYPVLEASPASLSTAEPENHLNVIAGESVQQDISLKQGSAALNPQVFGTNGHLSTIAVPLMPGKRYTIFVGGHGVDQISGDGISVTSPFIKVNAATLTLQSGVNYKYPIVSFDVEVAPDSQLGDYSIRLQSKTGEVAYISGGLTIDEASGARNPAAMFGVLGGFFKSLIAR